MLPAKKRFHAGMALLHHYTLLCGENQPFAKFLSIKIPFLTNRVRVCYAMNTERIFSGRGRDEKMKKIKKHLKRLFAAAIVLGLLGGGVVLVINWIMLAVTDDMIVSAEEAAAFGADCILVLGAGVRDDGTPSDMLRDRIDTGIMLYDDQVAPKLLMTGDHGREGYDEVNVMRERAMAADVPSQDIFMDHAGFSTYDSLYRARDVFGVSRVVIVTQEYHLPRALYIARSLGIEAVGVSADLNVYFGQFGHDLREIAARVKGMLYCWFKPEPTYLGEMIPISGNGEATLG